MKLKNKLYNIIIVMSKSTKRTFITSDAFKNLVPEIDKKATREKGPGRPVY
jgi:putative DNA methylase